MDATIINPFLSSAVNVLKTMASIEAKPHKPEVKKHNQTLGDVTGVIGMQSDALSGSMVVSFSKSCILQVLANMFHEPPRTKVDNSVIDAVGELTNMICGGAKAELAKLDYRFNMASPTMITGKGAEITYHGCGPTIVIPFTTNYGNFVVEANLCRN